MLKRRQLTPNDFVVYIKYELNLEKLRELRCQRIEESAQSREEKDAIRNIKACFSRHVCYIFDRALRRFASEASIWADYIDYLKKNSSNALLNTALGRAIALFPKDENMWIEAAAHEMNNNNSAETARKLLQRALRVNKTGKRLWKRYFELELWNAGRIVNRKKILKIEEAEEARERLRVVSAPLVVFKYAIAAVPDVEFAYELYDLSLAVSEDIADSIMNEMKKALGHLSSMWAHLSYAEVGKKIRILSMTAEESGVGPAEEGSTSAALLSKFAAVTSVLTEGMEILEAGLDKFGVGSRAAAEPDIQVSSKNKRSKRNTEEPTSDLALSTEGTLECSSADIFKFLDSYSKSMHVCISGVSAIYDQLSAETSESTTEEFCAQVLAAFRVLDAGLSTTKRVLQRLIPVVGTDGDNACMLVLSRLRLGILLKFTDCFSSKWFVASTTITGASSGSKKRKSTSVKSDDRQAMYDDVLAISLEGAKDWLSESTDTQIQKCKRAVLTMADALSHYWLVVADAALTYVLTASERCHDSTTDVVDASSPGKFWWCVLHADSSVDLSDLTDELCKAICRAVQVNFSHVSSASKISATMVIGKAQDVLLRSSSMSLTCDRRIFLSECLQSAIRSKHITAEDRMYWICEYIKVSYGVIRNMVAVASSENVRAGRAAYEWCVSALNSMPGVLHLHTATKESASLMTLYDQVFEMEEVDEFLEDRKNNSVSKVCDSDKITFLNKIVESALRDCPGDHSLLDLCAEYYSCTGNHKKANHLRWKKNNSSDTA